MPPSCISIFSTRIDHLSREETLRTIDGFLQENAFHHIATVNPEFLLEARTNRSFRDTLNACDLNIVDGFGLHLAFLRKGMLLRDRMTGADLTVSLLRHAEKNGQSVFFAIRRNGLSLWEDVRKTLTEHYPKLRAAGADIGWETSPSMLRADLREKIQNADIVLCNFGAPYQELFLAALGKGPKTPRLAIGIGGSLDFLTGKAVRAPKWMRQYGIEWLWRLMRQPKRFRRIVNAVILFPLLVIADVSGKR